MSELSTREVSRRALLAGSIVGAAGLAAGASSTLGTLAKAVEPAAEPEKWDRECDVLILGAGGTGLVAACAAADAGADVLVVECAEEAGGTTSRSAGIIQAAGTKWQKEFTDFQNDTPELHAKCYLEQAEGLADEALVTKLCERAPEMLEWLADIGVVWADVYGSCHVPYVSEGLHADRIHAQADGARGTRIIELELAEAERLGAKVEYETTARRLVFDKECGVLGVIVEKGGSETAIKARRGVVIALGGYDRNEELSRALCPQNLWDMQTQSLAGNEFAHGDGILMGLSVGAGLATFGGTIDIDRVTSCGSSNIAPQVPGLIVNSRGCRFVCEDATYAYVGRAVFQQATQVGGDCYLVFDSQTFEQGLTSWAEDPEAAVAEGAIFKGETLAEIAKAIDVPASNLQATFDLWNANIEASGEDLQFGRNTQLIALDKPPYYASKMTFNNLGSMGGLAINDKTEVLDTAGNPIPGLYAGGLSTGGWYGTYYPGSGTALAGTLVWGRIAGENASARTAE